MAGTARRFFRVKRHNPAALKELKALSIPESWARIMQVDHPREGVNICCMNGRPDAPWTFPVEGGASFSMSILQKGCIEAGFDNGERFRLDGGYVSLTATGEHLSGWDTFTAEQGFRLVNIHLTPEALCGLTGLNMDDVQRYMKSAIGVMPHINASVAMMPIFSSLQRLAAEIAQCSYLDSKARNVFLCAKVCEAIAAMLDTCSREQGSASTLKAVPSDRLRLLQARAMLEDRHHESWSVQSLAQAVGLNEKRLQAGFNALYGSTVHESLTRIRLDVALAMLSSGANVTDTAQAVGFANVSHFSKVFRNTFGISPKRWVHGHRATE